MQVTEPNAIERRRHVNREPAERRRVQRHILGAERVARSRDVSDLRPDQRYARALLLTELARYRRAGVFPRNPDFDVPMPYFIDAGGVRCAMAHLMEIGGAADLVREIAATRNNAFVAELADDPRVRAWLDAAGISVVEAARIQPSYCPSPPHACVCAEKGATLVLRGTPTGSARLKVTEIAGAGQGPCATVMVGDDLPLSSSAGGGEAVTAVGKPMAAGDGGSVCGAFTVHVATGGASSCHNGLASTRLPADLSPAETLDALAASDCEENLRAKDEAWATPPASECSSGYGRVEGCSAAAVDVGGSGLTTATVLAAVLAYRAARALGRAR